MKCDACGNDIIGKPHKPEYCKYMILCEECSKVDPVKETDNREEMAIIIQISKREAKKRFFGRYTKTK